MQSFLYLQHKMGTQRLQIQHKIKVKIIQPFFCIPEVNYRLIIFCAESEYLAPCALIFDDAMLIS